MPLPPSPSVRLREVDTNHETWVLKKTSQPTLPATDHPKPMSTRKNRNLYDAGEDSDDEYGASVYRQDTERELGADEEAWNLDEMSEALPAYDDLEQEGQRQPGELARSNTDNDPDAIHDDDSEDTKEKKIERMVRDLVAMAGPPGPKTRLPMPVIIPQRRPGAKKRGFVRAYAPVLQDTGISQEVFLRFINDFHKASQVRHPTSCPSVIVSHYTNFP